MTWGTVLGGEAAGQPPSTEPVSLEAKRRSKGTQAVFRRGDHVEIAQRLVTDLRAVSPCIHADGHFYQYRPERGIFETVAPSQLSTSVQRFAGAPVDTGKGQKPLRISAGDVAGAVRLAADQVSDAGFFDAAPMGIAFSGSFVRVTADGIHEAAHSAENRARFAYPFPYSASAEPGRLLTFFGEVFRDDSDRAEKVALVQEFLGVALLGQATRFQKALVLVGDGANGKGVLSSVLERCMPPGAVCAIPPQELGQEYRRALLAGKLLNIVSELPEADILDSESWKAVIAGDTTTGREIRKEPFSFKPVAGHIYSANRLPGTTDQSHGFWRRLLVIKFNRVFGETEQDPNLADRIAETEARAVVSWALTGAQRVFGTGRFTVPSSAASALADWQRKADQVRAFIEERATRLPPEAHWSEGERPERLYKTYRAWALENGHKPLASPGFGERMRLLGLGAHRGSKGVRAYPVRLNESEATWSG